MVRRPQFEASYTYVLVGGLVGADKVGVKPRQTDDGPDGEETHHHLQDGADQESRSSQLFRGQQSENMTL